MLARRTFSGDAMQQQQQPQSAYDTSPSLVPSTLRPAARPGPRPLAEYGDRPSPSELDRPPPLLQTSQSQPKYHSSTVASTASNRYTFSAGSEISDIFAHRILDERTDDLYGGMEEQSASPLSVNTSLPALP
ncbi:hypothetical protein FS749_009961 [Ceratobasidium sp. UAMH 11750]|nr:hypothetical protein FS749_009961 [Ceratobasidium sp. UAMH 11750]